MSAPNVVVIAVSTGGPPALDRLFGGLPPVNAAVVVVLHIPAGIDRAIARRLDAVSVMPASLLADGDRLEAGCVYVAPGGCHLRLVDNRTAELVAGGPVNYVRPCADLTMRSLTRCPGERLVGVVLTGMGDDGAEGVRHIKAIGGTTIAQDERTATIGGMPRAARETGAVDFVLPLGDIGPKLVALLNGAPGVRSRRAFG